MTTLSLATVDLINKVREKPELWDRHHMLYKDKSRKIDAWLQICLDTIPDFANMSKGSQMSLALRVTKKWYNIRDTYVKNIKVKPGQPKRKYVYSGLMSFLEPIYTNKVNNKTETFDIGYENNDERSSGDDNEATYYEEEHLEEYDSKQDPETMCFVSYDQINNANNSSNNVELGQDGMGIMDFQGGNDKTISVVSKLIADERDEDRAFFNSLMPSVKSLSEEAKLEFRFEVLKVLKNLKGRGKL